MVDRKPSNEERKAEQERYQRQLGRKIDRRMASQERDGDNMLFGLGLFGVVGWSVAIPTLIGILIGWWLDSHYPGSYSWTLMLMVLGVLLGCLNAWRWINQGGPQ